MSSTSKPRHGEPIITITDKFGGKVGIPTRQFQTFLDELDVTVKEVIEISETIESSASSSVIARLVQLRKAVQNLEDRTPKNLLPYIKTAFARIDDIDSGDNLGWRALLQLQSKRIDDLENQKSPAYFQSYQARQGKEAARINPALLSRINQLLKVTNEQAQQIGSLRGQNGRLSTLVQTLFNDQKINIASESSNYTQLKTDDLIVMSGANTITLLDPTLAYKYISLRNKTGSAATVTVTAAAGTTETTSLTDGQAVILAPVGTVWTIAH